MCLAFFIDEPFDRVLTFFYKKKKSINLNWECRVVFCKKKKKINRLGEKKDIWF